MGTLDKAINIIGIVLIISIVARYPDFGQTVNAVGSSVSNVIHALSVPSAA